MKFLLPLAFASALVACTTNSSTRDTDSSSVANDSASQPATSAAPSAREGWNEVKSGTKEIAADAKQETKSAGREMKEDAKTAGQNIKEGAIQAGHNIKAAACPIVASKTSKLYYTKSSKQYDAMLKGEKVFGSDNRECFSSEENAREGGYAKAQ